MRHSNDLFPFRRLSIQFYWQFNSGGNSMENEFLDKVDYSKRWTKCVSFEGGNGCYEFPKRFCFSRIFISIYSGGWIDSALIMWKGIQNKTKIICECYPNTKSNRIWIFRKVMAKSGDKICELRVSYEFSIHVLCVYVFHYYKLQKY